LTLWLVAVLAGIGVLLVCFFMTYLYFRYMPIIMTLFEEAEVRLPSPTEFRLDGEDVDFESIDGVPLKGIFVEGKDGNHRTVLFCHEYGGSMHSLGRYAGSLLDRGFNLFAFDFRGHGASPETNGYVPRQWVTDKEVNDILGAIEYLKSRPDLDSSNLGLFGISRGAGAGVCAAAAFPGIKALVLDSAFSTRLTVEKYMKRWAPIYGTISLAYGQLPGWCFFLLGFVSRLTAQRRFKCTFPPVERRLGQLRARPLYMIYGDRDKYVGMDQARELFDRAREPKELWIVPGARHNGSVTVVGKEYADNVASFFERSL